MGIAIDGLVDVIDIDRPLVDKAVDLSMIDIDQVGVDKILVINVITDLHVLMYLVTILYIGVPWCMPDHLVKGTIDEEDADRRGGILWRLIYLFDGMDNTPRRLLQVYIKLGWKKLDKYYALLASAAYVGAVIFHPCKK